MTDEELDQHLSRHFTIREMVRSHHGSVNDPDGGALFYMVTLCNLFLEPLREKFGRLFVTSGYRSPAVNDATPGASVDSAHTYGCAADIVPMDGNCTIADMLRWIVKESGLDFDQAIDEMRNGSNWLHFGILRPNHEPKPRKQALVFRDGIYTPFVG